MVNRIFKLGNSDIFQYGTIVRCYRSMKNTDIFWGVVRINLNRPMY